MGTQKKEASRREREGKVKDGNIHTKGENFYRNASEYSRSEKGVGPTYCLQQRLTTSQSR